MGDFDRDLPNWETNEAGETVTIVNDYDKETTTRSWTDSEGKAHSSSEKWGWWAEEKWGKGASKKAPGFWDRKE